METEARETIPSKSCSDFRKTYRVLYPMIPNDKQCRVELAALNRHGLWPRPQSLRQRRNTGRSN
jgi:hypothetical protein